MFKLPKMSGNCVSCVIYATVCCFMLFSSVSSEEDSFCQNLVPQRDLNLNMILRKWYIKEIIHHNTKSIESVNNKINSCPIVYLTSQGPSAIRLLWEEDQGTDEYFFDIHNSGIWTSMGHQKGSLVTRSYKQFHGNVLVLKAVDDHMVLTWCSETDNLFYTLLLSRDRSLGKVQVNGVHSMLERWRLSLGKIDETCNNSPGIHHHAAWFSTVLLCLLLWTFY